MNITITLHCPDCQGAKIKKNGKKSCKSCGRQFIGDRALSYIRKQVNLKVPDSRIYIVVTLNS